MDQALLQLAFGMHHNPGIYALLIGSGVSRSAEIPTGWMIVQDLIRKVATATGEEVDDPVAWYSETFEEEPTYSRVLVKLAQTPAERNSLLREYFEPTDDEKEAGIKQPTVAHRQIAWLAKQGYIKVILTTNFDRLVEQALEAEGVVPNVYSSEDEFGSMAPIQHSDVAVIKLHGDYLDWRIRNSEDELTEYPSSLVDLLTRIFQEYGLIICGWSGEYDIALREQLVAPRNPRTPQYGTFWAAFQGNLTEAGQEVVQERVASTISIRGANEFFTDLRDAIEALAVATEKSSLPVAVLTERTKKYLRRPEFSIDLEDLLQVELESAYKAFTSQEFSERRGELTNEFQRWELYCTPMERLIDVLVAIGWYGDQTHTSLLVTTLDRLLAAPTDQQYLRYRFIPALLAIYAVGISAINRNNRNKWYLLDAILNTTRALNPGTREYSSGLAICNDYLILETYRAIPNISATGESLFERNFRANFEQAFSNYIVEQSGFEKTFDLFEMVMSIVYLKQIPDRGLSLPRFSGQRYCLNSDVQTPQG